MLYRSCVLLSACALSLLFSSSAVEAQDVAALATDLGAAADLVVAGRISRIAARWDGSTIYEYVTVHVSDRLGGRSVPESIVLKQLGGRVGAIGLHIEGQAAFAAGEDVVLFLAARPRDRTLHTVGLARGAWRLLPDLGTGGRRAIPPSGRMTGLDAAASSAGLTLDEVRAIAASMPVHGDPIVTTPPETERASPAYTYLPTDGGPPARWHEVDDSVALAVDFQAGAGGQGELSNAMSRWSSGGTRLRLAPGSGFSPSCSAFEFRGDHRIRVYFNDPCGDVPDASSLGVGGGYFTTGDRRTINGTEFQAFIQGFAIVNDGVSCLEAALTHTLGHTIGLGDSNAAGAIMQPSLPGNCSSSLGTDDLNGLRAIYPAVASGPNPPAAPTAFTATALLNTVDLRWTPATTGGPAEAYLIEAGTGPGLANLVTLSVNAPQTTLSVGGVAQGIYYVRVKARNVRGTSGPSIERIVNVGNCTAPGTPQSLSAAINDTAVNLTWAPPAGGSAVQSYLLAAGTAPGLSNILVTALPAAPTALAAIAPYGDYYVRLHAQNGCGLSEPTRPDLLVRTQPCTGPPNMPALTFTRNGNQVTFNWTLAPGGAAPTQYWIGVGQSSDNYNLLVTPTPGLTPSFSAAGPSGTYFVRVAAQNACGFSQLSNEVQVVIP